MIRAEISSDTIATSCGITVHTGSPVLAICRQLVAEGADQTASLQAFRGDKLALTVRSIGEAARLRVVDGRFQQAPEPVAALSVSAVVPSTLAA
jgi:hypothetical protein